MEQDRFEAAPLHRKSSYHPTRWALANRALEILDNLTQGHAEWFQRLFTFLFSGGIAGLVNLAVFALVLQRPLPVNDIVHNLIAYVAAAETSIVANFLLNDRLTFRYLPGHARPWWARCARFHVTVAAGTGLTYVIQFVLHYPLHVPSVVAEALAIIIVTAFNFTFHHIFTYRRVKPAAHA